MYIIDAAKRTGEMLGVIGLSAFICLCIMGIVLCVLFLPCVAAGYALWLMAKYIITGKADWEEKG